MSALRVALLVAVLGATGVPAWAGDAPPGKADPAPAVRVGVVAGHDVNLRVGPRVDERPIRQLEDGEVVRIVERVPGWVGVQVPAGFRVAVAARYVTPVGADAVRVEVRRLNLRVAPPQEGRPMPGAFREQVQRGTLLPVVERAGDWIWVMAPESVRAYVSAPYVRELGPESEHAAIVEAARKRRRARIAELARVRRERAARLSGETLRKALGEAQQALYKLRVGHGMERAPVMVVINQLEKVMAECRQSPVAVRKLARAVRQDLEAELEMRTARKDAEVARLRGLEPPPERPEAPVVASVEARGVIRWEAAPTWRNGGEWVLWVDADPVYVLELTTGLPHPLPDLKGNADKGPRVVRGSQPGQRVFGLPVLLVRSIAVPPATAAPPAGGHSGAR
jgi:hypothetical protein